MSSYTKLTKAQLIQRVQQLEPMLEMLPAIVYLYAIREQRLIYLNRDLDAMLGDVPRSREAYQLDDLLARVHPDDMPRVRAHMQKMQRVSDDAYAEIEYRLRRQDESWMWIAARERVFERDADGQPVILFAVCQDISAYKDTESVLRARETRLKSFLDAAPDAMFVVDAQGKVLLANSQTEILFGYTQAELTGMSIDLLIPPDLRARHDTMFREYLASPERVSTLRANINALRRDGTTVPVAISLSRQTIGAENVIFGILHDLSAREQAARTLQASEERYRVLVESMDVVVTRWLPDTTLVYANEKCKSVFGLHREPITERWSDMLPGETRAATLAFYRELAANPRAVEYEHPVLIGDGSTRYYRWNDTPIFDAEGKLTEFQSVGIDITEQQENEAALRRNVELVRVTQESAQMVSWTMNLDTHAVEIGPGIKYLMDIEPGAYPLAQIDATVFPQDHERLRAAWSALHNNLAIELEVRVLVHDQLKWVHLKTQPRTATDDAARVVHGFVQDVTERRQAVDMAAAQRDLARLGASTASLDQVMMASFETALRVSAMDSGGIYLLDESKRAFVLAQYAGLDEAFVSRVALYPVDLSYAQTVLAGESVFMDMAEAVQFPEYREQGLRSIAIVPIRYKGQVVGCLNVASHLMPQVPELSRRALQDMSAEIGNLILYFRTANALRESEDKYRTLIESHESIILTLDAEGVIHFINHPGAAFLGDSPEALVGRALREFFPPETFAWQMDQVRQVIQSGQSTVMEYQTEFHKREHWRRGTIHPVRDAEGQVVLALVNSQDVTEQKQRERALQETRARLEEAQRLARLGNWEWDLRAQTLRWSDEVYRIFGVEPGSFSPTVEAFEGMIHPEDKAEFLRQRAAVLADKNFANIEHRIVLPDGQIRHVQERTHVVRDDRGESVRVIGTVQDITERKQADAARRESEVHYRLLFETMAQGVVFQDADGRIIDANYAAEEILGLTLDQMQGRTSIDPRWKAVHADGSDFPGDTHPAMVTLRTGKAVYDTMMGVYNPIADSTRWIFINATPRFKPGETKPYQVYTTFEDITKRKQAEDALRESEERYRLLFETMVQGIVFQDAAGHIIDANNAAEEILGLTLDQMQGRDSTNPRWKTFNADGSDFPADAHPAMVALRTGHAVYDTVMGVYNPVADKHLWLNINAMPRFKPGETKPYQVYTTIEDITERKRAQDALRAERDFSQTLIQSSAAFFVAINADGTVKMMNNSVLDALGYTLDEVVGQAYLSMFVPQAEHPKIVQDFEHMVHLNQSTQNENHIRAKDGTLYLVEWHGRPVLQDGVFDYFFGVGIDITARKRAEAALAESEKKFRAVVESSPDTICTVDEALRIQFINRVPEGMTVAKAQGTALLDYAAPEFRALVEQKIRHVFETGEPTMYEARARGDTGKVWWYSTQVAPYHTNSETRQVLLITTEITARKEAEEKLRDSNETAQAILNAASESVFLMQTDGTVIAANATTAARLGTQVSALIGHSIFDWLPPEVAAARKLHVAAVVAQGEPARFEDERFGVWLENNIYPITDADGQIRRLAIYGRDVTERKQMEQALLKNQALLNEAQRIGRIGYMEWTSPDPVLACSDELNDIFELPREMPITQELMASMMLPAERDRMLQLDQQFIGARADIEYEYSIQLNGGRTRWLYQHGKMTYDENGIPVRMMAIVQDVTERHQADIALRASQARAQAMLDAIPDLMFRLDRDGVFLDYQADLSDLYSQDVPDLRGKRNRDISPREFADFIDEKIRLTLETRALQTFEYQLPIPEQGMRYYEARMVPSGADEVTALVRDITESKLAEEELRASQARFATIFEHTPMPIGVTRLSDGKLAIVNSAFCNFSGYTAQELLGHSTYELGIWTGSQDRAYLIGELQKQRRVDNLEAVMRTKAGALRTVLISAEIVELNREPSILLQIIDITDLKEAEQALLELTRTLEERVQQRTAEVQDLYENAPAGYHSLDAQGCFIRINQTELDWLGYARAELVGRPFTEVLTLAGQEIFKSGFPELVAHGILKDIEVEMVRRDGSILPALVNAVAVMDANGNFLMTRTTVLDNTDRKRAEQALRESEQQNRLLFEESPDAVMLFDSAGRVVRLNHAAEMLLDKRAAEIIGRRFDDVGLLNTQEMARVTDNISDAVAAQNLAAPEFKLKRADGDVRDIGARVFMLSIYDKQHYLVTMRDITLQKQAEETLRRANVEMERALRLKDEFLANMSHELRTPLNAILGLSEVLSEHILGPLNERQLQAVGTIESSGRHLLNLINEILDLSKIEAGAMTLERNPFSVQALCENCMLFIKQPALKKRLKLATALDVNVEWIEGDERRLRQVLVNLLSNAVKFTDDGGMITLSVQGDAENKTATFSVTDTGIGISEPDMQRLFKPFVQLDSSLSRRYEGTGLGLSLVARMVELHGGSVSVSSQLGQGSCFTITLPWSDAMQHYALKSASKPAPVETAETIVTPDAHAPLILIVEDNPTNLTALSAYLQARGFNLATARNGVEAIDMAHELFPSLILMDLQMPVMDGLDATRRLRASVEPRVARVPIIALTALAMPGDREQALAAGANEYLSKPVNFKLLTQTIQTLLVQAGDKATGAATE